jgi:peptidoglycan/LPS O-acetylase OafA/YrhL
MTALPLNPDEAPRAAAGAERFALLDGLRGIAAFAVILDHTPPNFLGELVPGRYLAVDFFFVLSGFVLAHAYGRRLEGGWSVFSFMRARVIRLYPLYLAGLAIGVSLVVLGVVRGWDATPIGQVGVFVLFGLLFLPAPPIYAFGDGALFPFNGPAWSLFFELVVNFIYGLIARFLNRWVLAVILVAGAVAVVFTVLRHQGVGGPGWLWSHFDAGLARVVFDFFAGVAIYRMRGAVKLPVVPAVIPVLAFVAVIMAQVPAEWRAGYDAAVAIVVMPLLVTLASQAKVAGWVERVCGTLGTMSYGVYVLHVPLLGLLYIVAVAAGITLPGWGIVVAIVVMAGGAAAFLHHTYDGPMRRWLSRTLPGGASG